MLVLRQLSIYMKADPKQCVYILLTRLGSTADGVAASLASMGIRGSRFSHAYNPLSKYLRSKGVKFATIYIETPSVELEIEWRDDASRMITACYPRYCYPKIFGVRNFLIRFNGGSYNECRNNY